MIKTIIGLTLLSVALVGCSSGGATEVTQDQEKVFRNPSKEIPPDIQKKIAASMAAGKQGAQAAQQNKPAGGDTTH